MSCIVGSEMTVPNIEARNKKPTNEKMIENGLELLIMIINFGMLLSLYGCFDPLWFSSTVMSRKTRRGQEDLFQNFVHGNTSFSYLQIHT